MHSRRLDLLEVGYPQAELYPRPALELIYYYVIAKEGDDHHLH